MTGVLKIVEAEEGYATITQTKKPDQSVIEIEVCDFVDNCKIQMAYNTKFGGMEVTLQETGKMHSLHQTVSVYNKLMLPALKEFVEAIERHDSDLKFEEPEN